MPDSSIKCVFQRPYAHITMRPAGCSNSSPVMTSMYVTLFACLPVESRLTFVTHARVRNSTFGSRRAIGMTAMCGLPFAFASQPNRSQWPQYWQAPNFAPSGFVYACEAFAAGDMNG